MALPDFDNWCPLSVKEIAVALRNLEWILAGGFALEEFVGKPYRKHADIDVLIERKDQKLLTNYIDASRIFVAEDSKLKLFEKDKYYDSPIQDIWILSEDFSRWCLQIMLYDTEDDFWIYKRNKNIKLPQNELFWIKNGIKIIKPEIQLLYKSNNVRPKDEYDFETIEKELSQKSKRWLNDALKECYDLHKWSRN